MTLTATSAMNRGARRTARRGLRRTAGVGALGSGITRAGYALTALFWRGGERGDRDRHARASRSGHRRWWLRGPLAGAREGVDRRSGHLSARVIAVGAGRDDIAGALRQQRFGELDLPHGWPCGVVGTGEATELSLGPDRAVAGGGIEHGQRVCWGEIGRASCRERVEGAALVVGLDTQG